MHQTARPATSKAALVRLVLALLALSLASACGGDVSWCFSDGTGAVSAGYDHDQCPPATAESGSVAMAVDSPLASAPGRTGGSSTGAVAGALAGIDSLPR